jgi:hypothetical protein
MARKTPGITAARPLPVAQLNERVFDFAVSYIARLRQQQKVKPVKACAMRNAPAAVISSVSWLLDFELYEWLIKRTS